MLRNVGITGAGVFRVVGGARCGWGGCGVGVGAADGGGAAVGSAGSSCRVGGLDAISNSEWMDVS